MRKAAPPSHRTGTTAESRRRSFVALGVRCTSDPVLAPGGLAALHAALRTIPSRNPRG